MDARPLRASFGVGEAEALDPVAANLDLKTKLTIVKKALLAERKKTQELEARISLLEATVQERDAKVRDLQQENSQLEYELFCERSRVKEMASSPTGSSRSKLPVDFDLDTTNQTLTQEFHSLKQANLALDSQLSALQQYCFLRENQDLTAALENRNSHLTQLVRDQEAAHKQLKASAKELEAKLEALREEKAAVELEKGKLEERVVTLSRSFAQSSDEVASLQTANSDLQQVVAHLNQSLISHAQNEGLLAEKLMTLKEELLDITSELRFEVLKINKVINKEAKVAFQKAPDGRYTFEIDQKNRKKSYFVENIEEVCVEPSNPRRFFLRLSVSTTQSGDLKVFESPEAAKLVEKIRRFIARVSC